MFCLDILQVFLTLSAMLPAAHTPTHHTCPPTSQTHYVYRSIPLCTGHPALKGLPHVIYFFLNLTFVTGPYPGGSDPPPSAKGSRKMHQKCQFFKILNLQLIWLDSLATHHSSSGFKGPHLVEEDTALGTPLCRTEQWLLVLLNITRD